MEAPIAGLQHISALLTSVFGRVRIVGGPIAGLQPPTECNIHLSRSVRIVEGPIPGLQLLDEIIEVRKVCGENSGRPDCGIATTYLAASSHNSNCVRIVEGPIPGLQHCSASF